MDTTPLQGIRASSEDVYRIIAKISPALVGEDLDLVFITCLSLAVMLQAGPNGTPEILVSCVKSLSENLSLNLSMQLRGDQVLDKPVITH